MKAWEEKMRKNRKYRRRRKYEEKDEWSKRGGRGSGLLKVRSLISHCGSRH